MSTEERFWFKLNGFMPFEVDECQETVRVLNSIWEPHFTTWKEIETYCESHKVFSCTYWYDYVSFELNRFWGLEY